MDGPELPAYLLNEALPIKDVDETFMQGEQLFEAGSGQCSDSPAENIVDECRVVSVPDELGSNLSLWRHAYEFVDQEIAAGARQVLSEEVTGHTLDDETFHWRAVAVKYPKPADASLSPAWSIINACDDLQLDRPSGVVTLSEGDEPFLMARIDDSTLYIVETWIATDNSLPLDDTETGLPPLGAVSQMMAWIIDNADDVAPPSGR